MFYVSDLKYNYFFIAYMIRYTKAVYFKGAKIAFIPPFFFIGWIYARFRGQLIDPR